MIIAVLRCGQLADGSVIKQAAHTLKQQKIIFKIKKKDYSKERNSFKMKTKFENYINGTLCTVKQKDLEVRGFAKLRPEDKNSKMTGETIAYHKANRLLVKEKLPLLEA